MSIKKTTTAEAPTLEVLQSEIKAVAETIYTERQAKHQEGDELSDWLKAEVKVKAKYKL
jgi:hypothetical protein